MGSPGVTHWPNRPELPWYWFSEWGHADPPLREITLGDLDDPAWCCISNITLSIQVGVAYFDLELTSAGQRETLLRVLVTDTSPVSLAFPTPLVVGGNARWSLSGGPAVVPGLFQATLVGYWSRVAVERDAPQTLTKRLASALPPSPVTPAS